MKLSKLLLSTSFVCLAGLCVSCSAANAMVATFDVNPKSGTATLYVSGTTKVTLSNSNSTWEYAKFSYLQISGGSAVIEHEYELPPIVAEQGASVLDPDVGLGAGTWSCYCRNSGLNPQQDWWNLTLGPVTVVVSPGSTGTGGTGGNGQ